MIDSIAAPPDLRWHFGRIESAFFEEAIQLDTNDRKGIFILFEIRENSLEKNESVSRWIELLPASGSRQPANIKSGCPNEALIEIDAKHGDLYFGFLDRMAIQAAVNRKMIVDRQKSTKERR